MPDRRTAPRKTNDSPLARIRIDKGLTQEELAALAGCHPVNISRWEHGTRIPSGKSLVKLAKALGVPMEELL